MSSPAVRSLAMKLARSPYGASLKQAYRPGAMKRPPSQKQPYDGSVQKTAPGFGGPIQKQPFGLQGGWNDSLAKEPVFRSPGLKHPSKGTPITRWSNQPYRF